MNTSKLLMPVSQQVLWGEKTVIADTQTQQRTDLQSNLKRVP